MKQRKRGLAAALALTILWAAQAGAAAAPARENGGSGFAADVARHLGVPEAKLKQAVTAARLDRVRSLLRQGRITEADAKTLEQAIRDGRWPAMLKHRHARAFGRKMVRQTAAYVGLSPEAFVARLREGQSPAAIATAQGRTPAGLEQALVAKAKEQIANAVRRGRLTRVQAGRLEARLGSRVHRFVEGGGRPSQGAGEAPAGSS